MSTLRYPVSELDNYKTTVSYKPNYMKVRYSGYPTHLTLYPRKTQPDKLAKINGQSIYNGAIKHQTRRQFMTALHKILLKNLKIDKAKFQSYLPAKISMLWCTVPNHESVKVIKNKLIVSELKLPTKPTFDVFNQFIWIKAFEDMLVSDLKVLPDDNVQYIYNSGGIEFIPIKDFDKRYIEFKIEKSNKDYGEYYRE